MKLRNPVCWLTLVVLCGCKHHPTAKERDFGAYLAGQRQAIAQFQESQRTSIRVLGNVRNPEIAWTDGLTLANALVAAECLDRRNPRQIFIIRQTERIPVDPKTLLRGDDFLLAPGDTIEIQP